MHATRRLILTAAAGLTLMMSGITAATAADEPAKGPNGLPILKVGTSGTLPRFEFHNSETGELVGFEIDLVRAIGQKMGRDVVISDFSFDAILPAITSGTIDMGAAGFAKTAERAKRIHFCDTFYYSGLTIIKRKGDTRINGIEDLGAAGLDLARTREEDPGREGRHLRVGLGSDAEPHHGKLRRRDQFAPLDRLHGPDAPVARQEGRTFGTHPEVRDGQGRP